MLVHQLLDPGDVAVAIGGGHRGDQVVYDRGVGAALGLGALAGVVNYEGVKEGNVAQRQLRVTSFGQADALPG